MTYQEETRPGEGRAPESIGKGTDKLQRITSDPHFRPTTQLETVLRMLMDAPAVCGSQFYSAYIPRFSAHIHTLRKAGYWIVKRACDLDHYHVGQGWLYELVALPHDPSE